MPRTASFTCAVNPVCVHIPRKKCSVLAEGLEISVIYAALEGTTWSYLPRLSPLPAIFVFFYRIICL